MERVDFEDEALWLEQFLEPGTHLVGHSYGGVISLFAAARHPELLRSLTVIEPPAFGIARGNPAADEFIAAIEEHWTNGPRDPAEFLRGFLTLVGSSIPPGNFTPELLQGARTLITAAVGLLAVAASLYMIYLLEIVKLTTLRSRRREQPPPEQERRTA